MRSNASVDSLDDTSKFTYEQQSSRWFVAYFKLLEKYGKYVFAFWIIVYMLSLFYGPKFLKMGDDSVKPPKNTPSWFAQNEFESRFAQQAKEVPILLLITSKSREVDITSPDLFSFAKQLKADILEYNSTTGDGNVLSIISYYELSGTLLDGAKQEFVSPNKDATFINIMVRGDRITHERYEFVKFLKKELKQLNPDPHLFFLGLTGFDPIGYDSMDDNAKNVMKIDMFTVPLAMCLLGFMVRSWRLLLFSFFNLGCAILSSFAFMAFLVNHFGAPHPESASAQLMEVITMAVSIDWSLFLHRRFRDEIKRGASPREAAFVSLMHSGHVVVMSGATLVVVFIGFIALPAATVQMDGACCAIGTAIAMLIALTNTPSIWLLFPEFCSDFDPKCCKKRTVEDLDMEAARLGISNLVSNHQMTSNSATRAPLISSEDNDDSLGSPLMQKKKSHVMYSGPRFRFTRWVTTFPNNVLSIVLVYILVIPFAFQLKDIEVNQNVIASMPRNSDAAKAYRKAYDHFPGGTFAPFYVMVTTKDAHEKDKALTSAFFEASKDVAIQTFRACKARDERFTEQSVTGPTLLSGIPITIGEAKTFLNTAKSIECNPLFGRDLAPWWKKPCSIAKEYELEWNQAVNADQNAMLITITVPFFPFAQESHDFIDTVYDVLDSVKQQHPNFNFHLCGVEVAFDALQRRVQSLFPQLIASTFIIVFVILGVLLRSAFVPFRLALTLVAPLCAVFGMAVVVYQKGALEWTGLAAFTKMDGFYWYIPILLLSMIIGLSLDWDVLLVSRIMEHREAGYDIRASICKAVCETGGTISTAGIIMCLAFGGMLFSDQLLINACGFILTMALLLDTFLVNTVLVPALISIGDKVAWWPVRMPMTDLKTLENCDEFPTME